MVVGKRWFWVGSRPAVRSALVSAFGSEPVAAAPGLAAGDVVVVDARADAAALGSLPGGHVFAFVRHAKEQKGVAVYVVVDASDRVGTQLARFVLADGVLGLRSDGSLDTSEIAGSSATPRRAPVDALLAKLEPKLGGAGSESSLQRLLRFEREDSLSGRLQDAETGLFDGPYAAWKLDEEWKRAHRFHQPLSLVLLDLGPRIADLQGAERRLVFAEAAGVFLNECRDIDVLARFAPTVFLFLLPGTGPDGAEILARRIVNSLGQRLDRRADLAPAAGVCSVPSSDVPDRKAFLAIAEACLARARASGAFAVSSTWQ
jgi:GGDEF domain-containing protein